LGLHGHNYAKNCDNQLKFGQFRNKIHCYKRTICNMLFAANIAGEQEVIAADITIALLILYLHASDVHQHSTLNRSRADTLL